MIGDVRPGRERPPLGCTQTPEEGSQVPRIRDQRPRPARALAQLAEPSGHCDSGGNL